MSALTIYQTTNPYQPVFMTAEPAQMAAKLAALGISFEQWAPGAPLPTATDDQTVLAAYTQDINRLKQTEGYQSVDVIRVLPDNPKRDEIRAKFLVEHTHDDDEARFFVEGSGMFYLHLNDQVVMILCTAGDFIRVPKSVRHWFDMGPAPFITAIRLFTRPDGWVAEFTGDTISHTFPKYELNQQAA